MASLMLSSQERMASMVISSSLSSSQPRRSAPVLITSREQPAANFLSLNFFFRLESSISLQLLLGRILAAAPISPVSSSAANSTFSDDSVNISELLNRAEEMEAEYNKLSEERKAQIKDYEKVAEAKAKLTVYCENAVNAASQYVKAFNRVHIGESYTVTGIYCIKQIRNETDEYHLFALTYKDAEKYIKIFTLLDRETIESAIEEHRQDPGQRRLQKLLAKEVTIMVHSEQEYEKAVAASGMLFGKSTSEQLRELDEKTFLDIFDGVPTFELDRSSLPLGILDALAVNTSIFPSKGEARKMIQGNGFSLNKDKVTDIAYELSEKDIIDGKYILAQKGKKDYYIIKIK